VNKLKVHNIQDILTMNYVVQWSCTFKMGKNNGCGSQLSNVVVSSD
jgi:hypothetical protein